jgi:phytanoyl-CoA hydroxylase
MITSQILDSIRDDLDNLGFATVTGAVSGPDLQQLRSEADRLVQRFIDGYRSEDYWCYDVPGRVQPMLYRIHNLENQGSALIANLFERGPLLELATTLTAVARPTVCAMVVKTPGVVGVPWHRDRTNRRPATMVNLSLFLDHATAANGCFEAVPGSHLLPDDSNVEAVRADGPRVPVPVDSGDVLIHDVRLVHGSGDNTTPAIRRSIIIEFDITSAED